MSRLKLKKGDEVIVTAGKDKGKTGEIIKVLPKDSKVVVQGVNMVSRHQRQTKTEEGGIISKEMPLHISNVAMLDPQDGKAVRVGFKIEDGRKVRIAKRSGDVIDG